jgi:hypothetical protein
MTNAHKAAGARPDRGRPGEYANAHQTVPTADPRHARAWVIDIAKLLLPPTLAGQQAGAALTFVPTPDGMHPFAPAALSTLASETRELYELLGTWRHRTVEPRVAAAILDCSVEEAKTQLRLLEAAGLLVAIDAGAWLRTDTVYADQSLRAMERLTTGQFQAAVLRLGDYLNAQISDASELIAPERIWLRPYEPANEPRKIRVFRRC